MAKRTFDLCLALVALLVAAVPMICIALLVTVTSRGPVFYLTDRVGRNNRLFKMCKFRTMSVGAPAVATHLLNDAASYLTPVGAFLRRYSLDELPQLFNIVRGQMSFVGPRPALFNQDDLIALRTARGIHLLVPGLTGWAQVNGRDELSIPEKVAYDDYYRLHRSLSFDLRIVFVTALRVVKREGVKH